MPHATLRPLLRHLGRSADLKDNELLERFAKDRDEAAFRTLVERHGRLVLAVCRRHAGHVPDAEDAFQATFLLLARKAPGLTRRPGVAGWLAMAARHLARRARRTATRRAAHESRAVPVVRTVPDPALADLGAVLDAELARLPDDEREAFTVCLLEGLSRTEAAERLGWPEGTVAGRLARARERLRDRLTRRGLTLSAALTAVGLAEAESVPIGLRESVVAAARSARSAARFTLAASVLLGLGTVFALGMGGGQSPPKPATPPTKGEVTARVDGNGDSLPERVLARIGHARFRHDGPVRALAVSPDGSVVATATLSGMVRLWDADTGRLRTAWRTTKAEYSEVHLAFLGKGDRLFVGTSGDLLPSHVADVATGKIVWKLGDDPDPIRPGQSATTRLSPDGKSILEVSATDGQARVLDRETRKSAFADRLVPEGAYLRTSFFLPDGKTFLLSTGLGGAVREYSAETGKLVREYPSGLSYANVTPSADGKLLAVFQRGDLSKEDSKDTVVLWDREKGEKLRTVERQFPDPICLAFSPDGKTFAVGSQGPDVILLSTADGTEVRRFKWHPSCMSLAFSADGKTLFTGDSGGQVAKWDVATGKQRPTTAVEMPDSVYIAEFRGAEVATDGDRFGWWDAATGRPLRSLADMPKTTPFVRPRLSPDGKRLVYYLRDYPAPGQLLEHDLGTGKDRVLADKLTGGMGVPQFAPDGKLIALAGGFEPIVYLFDAATGKLVHELKDHQKLVNNVRFSPDGKVLISHASEANAEGDYDIRVWDVATGKLRYKLLPVRGGAFQCAFTPDGKQLVSVGGEPGRSNPKGEAQVWDLATGRLLRTWDAHAERAVSVAVSPDGRSVLTSGIDRKLRLWDLSTGQLRHEFEGHTAYVHSLSFAPDGRRFLACSGDAPAYVWDVYGHLTAGPKPLSEKDLAIAWADLASEDQAVGFRAVGRLIGAGAPGAGDRLRPVAAIDGDAVEKWIVDLGAVQFAVREKASARLAQVADQARSRLRKALETETSAEVRERVKKLLDEADGDTPEWRQRRRAVEALEVIGTPEARAVLKSLAQGAPGARLTTEAAGALGRTK